MRKPNNRSSRGFMYLESTISNARGNNKTYLSIQKKILTERKPYSLQKILEIRKKSSKDIKYGVS